jgi:hypothetical protein
MVSTTDPYCRILGFIDRSRYIFFQVAEWTPFQTHYFLENLVVPGIEAGTSGSVAMTTRPQRRSYCLVQINKIPHSGVFSSPTPLHPVLEQLYVCSHRIRVQVSYPHRTEHKGYLNYSAA